MTLGRRAAVSPFARVQERERRIDDVRVARSELVARRETLGIVHHAPQVSPAPHRKRTRGYDEARTLNVGSPLMVLTASSLTDCTRRAASE